MSYLSYIIGRFPFRFFWTDNAERQELFLVMETLLEIIVVDDNEQHLPIANIDFSTVKYQFYQLQSGRFETLGY